MIRLSFIVPVYNVETYLRECLDSIICQVTDECEIILIDDGSTDNSGRICDEYGNKYANIRVCHKENGGVSSARNAGLDMATGEYTAFVDSDDRIAPESVEKILEWIDNTDADVCFMQAIKFFPDGKTIDLGENIHCEGVSGKPLETAWEYLSSRPRYPGSGCTKLYKLSFLKENDLRFPCDKRIAEDLGFIRDCLLAARKFDAQDYPFYEYRQGRANSITNRVTYRSFSGVSLFVEETSDRLTDNHIPIDNIADYMMRYAAYEYSIMLWHYGLLCTEDKKKAIEWLRRYKWVLRFSGTRKTNLTRITVKVFGIRLTSKLLGIYMKYFR